MTNEAILKIEDLHLAFGGLNALTGVSLEVRPGEILSIIGPNGAGKSSLLNCINGFYRPQRGRIMLADQDITRLPPHKIARLGISRTFQNIALYTGLTTLDNLMAARHVHYRAGLLPCALYFGRAHAEEIRHRKVVEDIIDFLEMEAIRKQVVGVVPYGQRKRVELGRALALEPKLLLLDEPLAGMNLEEKEDMVRFILETNRRKGIPMVLVEHDMGVVMEIADRVAALDFGCQIAIGSPEEVKADPRVIKAYLGEDESAIFVESR
ncbi:MAG: ABC transporter ATP-binding protein [Chloroflexota bacterium]|nr:MAG: ABC transporter ATP-binding protein [Chloroflexota bacterium]